MTAKNEPSTAHKIWNLLTSAERRSALLLLSLMFIGMILETLGVGLVLPALSLLTQGDIAHKYPTLQPILQTLGNLSQQNLIIGGMLVLVGMYFIKAIFLAFLAWRQTCFAFSMSAQLSQRLFNVYLRQPYTFHLQRNSAQLIRNVITEVGMFTGNGIQPGMIIITESLVLLGLCSMLLIIEPLGAIVVISVLGSASWGFHRLTSTRIQRWGEARQYRDGLRLQHLQQGMGGVKDVKLLGRELDFLERFRVHNEQSAYVGQLQSTLQQLPRIWLELFAVIGLAMLVISILAQGRGLEAIIPTLGLFAVSAFRIMPSVSRVLGAIQALRYGLPVVNLLYKEITLGVSKIFTNDRSIKHFHGALELSCVTYAYPNVEKPSLREVSLIIQRGETVGFIGASGAGKSTLVDILLGLLTPDAGEVRVDGKNIQDNTRNWQDQIGYVPQSIYLTDDTLLRNVAFGLPNEQIDGAAVQRAVQAAQLEGFVNSLPEGLETLVGERGVRLSGGQRQRIGIARALYHDPAVLVLDEATSSLDTDTEQGVMQAVTALHGRKTILIVAHRLSTVENCDRVYRMEHGKLIATQLANGMFCECK